jgi:hypothetical protein
MSVFLVLEFVVDVIALPLLQPVMMLLEPRPQEWCILLSSAQSWL